MSTPTSTTTEPEKEQMSSGTALVSQSRDEPQAEIAPPAFKPGFQFLAIMGGLSATSLIASLENSVVVTAGPSMVADLEMGEEYVWIANAFFVCCSTSFRSAL
ncbi:hypothetical protein HYALB_00000013 [Hymenoscyphus albidus]|uniref:Uncharacterized protein n=1 Tax=Hymenoscyphus albidus TaxID=595503 RepID=A0A9N9LJ30_9HELO|nr:hypothetical protein HYALB_00000013 [Hymenoscyphus albidus]